MKKYYHFKKLNVPRKEDFFIKTDEVEFQGSYEDVGYIDELAYQSALKTYAENMDIGCENRLGVTCSNQKCNYPKCCRVEVNEWENFLNEFRSTDFYRKSLGKNLFSIFYEWLSTNYQLPIKKNEQKF